MTEAQFIILMGTVVLSACVLGLLFVLLLPKAVEAALAGRWSHIVAMFDRALAHGGSLDTLSRSLREDSKVTQGMARDAVDVARQLKERVDGYDARLRRLEEHPLLRTMGGQSRPPL